jgi:ribonuclease HI
MKQLTFLDCTDPIEKPKETSHAWKLFIDGASRNNPGQAGAGVYVLKDEKPVYQEGFYLSIKTNNEAEYLALIVGIFVVKPMLFPDDVLYVISDSQLLVNQIKGSYKVRKPELKKMYDLAVQLLHGINFSLCHVLREFNKHADNLANQGIEKGNPVPPEFLQMLNNHGIPF